MQHVVRESFIYRWYFDGSSQWVVGDSPTSGDHHMEVRGGGASLCVDQLGPASLRVRAGQEWLEDGQMRIVCVDPQQRRGQTRAGCCQQVRVSSSQLGQEFQPGRLTVYRWNTTSRPSLNSYPVYTSSQGESLYLWDWGRGQGMNWFVGGEPTTNSRGLESPDIERKDDKCPERINMDRRPWRVFTTARRINLFDPRTGWREDESLRVECWDDAKNDTCCPRLTISSEGGAAEFQPDKMGHYVLWGSRAGRGVWRHEARQNFLYYWEWGVNTGTEWMVGHSPFSSERGIRSDNLEGLGEMSICFDDAEKVGDWHILTENNVWITDDTFRVQCRA